MHTRAFLSLVLAGFLLVVTIPDAKAQDEENTEVANDSTKSNIDEKADLVIMNENPLDGIRNTNTIHPPILEPD